MKSYKSGLGIYGIMQGSNIIKSAEDFGMLGNEVIVKVTQKLIGIKSSKTGNNHLYISLGSS